MAVRSFMTNNLVKEHDTYVEFMKKRNEEMKNSGAEPTEVLFYKRGLLGTRTDYAKDDYFGICKWHCITITYDIWYDICNQLYDNRIRTHEPYKDLIDVPDDALKKFKYRVEQSIKNARCDYNSRRSIVNGTYDAPRYLAMFWTYLDIVKDTETQRFYPTAETRKRAAKIFGYAENEDPFIMNGKYNNRANKKENDTMEDKAVDIYNIGIDELGFTTRTRMCFNRIGVNTLGEIREMTINDLIRIRNFGIRSLREVIDVLAKYGYFYPKDPNATEDDAGSSLAIYKKDQLPVLMTGAEDEPEEKKTKPIDNTALIAENMELKDRLNVHMWQSLEKLNNLEKENDDLKRKIKCMTEAKNKDGIFAHIAEIVHTMQENKLSYITLQIDGYSINITKESEE